MRENDTDRKDLKRNMLSKKYLNSVRNVPAMMKKIIDGTAPDKFTTEHLKKIGFGASNDRAIIGVLKDLGFLNEGGIPTQRYHDYRNQSKSKEVLGEALREAYSDIFHINEHPAQTDTEAIKGLFKSTHNSSDEIAGYMRNTFLSLLELADISARPVKTSKADSDAKGEEKKGDPSAGKKQDANSPSKDVLVPNLRYNIEVHLPATKDIEVYNSIFKSLREHLLND